MIKPLKEVIKFGEVLHCRKLSTCWVDALCKVTKVNKKSVQIDTYTYDKTSIPDIDTAYNKVTFKLRREERDVVLKLIEVVPEPGLPHILEYRFSDNGKYVNNEFMLCITTKQEEA